MRDTCSETSTYGIMGIALVRYLQTPKDFSCLYSCVEPATPLLERFLSPWRMTSLNIHTITRQRRRTPGRSLPMARFIPRSEEHTSELQSLMRISYDVFCLKKKNKH